MLITIGALRFNFKIDLNLAGNLAQFLQSLHVYSQIKLCAFCNSVDDHLKLFLCF